MAGKLVRNIWGTLNTDIELRRLGAIPGVERGKAVAALIYGLATKKSFLELQQDVEKIDSLLDVLNSPLGKVANEFFPPVSIATEVLTSMVEQTREKLTLVDSVELVSQVAYLESLRQFLRDHPEIQLQETPASATVAQQIKKLGETLEVNGREIEFDDRRARETLVCFYDSPLRKAFNPILQARLEESGLTQDGAKTVTERVSRNTHRFMKEAVAEVKDSAKKLASIYGDGWQRDLKEYASVDKYLKDVIAEKPGETVFDEEFAFRDVYVPLQVKPVKSDGKVDDDAEPENIEDWAKRILLDEEKSDRVLFIQAGPGRGKRVFCRMFADWVRRELHPIYTPILIRLRDATAFDADIDKTLSAAVGWDFVKSDNGWLTDGNTRFLFFLDGFDELLLERVARYDLKVFLEQVALFQKRAAENSDRAHRVIITGRPLALYGIERFMPQNLERVSILPMDGEIQGQWLHKWQKVVDADDTVAAAKTDKFREFLRDETCPEQVKELAREPLLLYLLAAMHRDQKLQVEMFAGSSAGEAKVLVYEQALEWVLEKQRSQADPNLNPEFTGLDPEALRALLAETGLCVVQSGREYAAISTIESRLVEKEDEGAVKLIENARKAGSDNPLKNALAAFYLKSAAGAENSVEFFHKSFGEFLCAVRMAESLEEWTSTSGKRRKTYAVATRELEWPVYDFFGYGALTEEIVEYLIALLVKNQVDLVVLFERLYEFYLCWCDGEFIEKPKPSEGTLPLKKASQLQEQNIDRGQRQVDIYAGLNVLILLLELHRYGQSQEELREKIAFHPCSELGGEDFAPTRLLEIISYSQCLGVDVFWQKVGKFLSVADLSGVDFSNANLSGVDFSDANLGDADLSDANLSDANLSSANLSYANLSYANLSYANFSDADLSNADLSDANLRGADLSDANLSGAYLGRANLSRADLSRANLSRAELSGVNLSRADLRDADLSGADFRGVDFRGADLSAADLSGANLSAAYLSAAYLSRTNLRGANLSAADLSGVYLNGADLSDTYLNDANFSRAKLCSAYLSGANLSAAYLSSANLSGANLSAAKLSGANLSDIKWNNELNWCNAIGLHEATVIPEALKQDPKFAAAVLLSRGYSQVREGKIEEAIASYQQGQTTDPQLEISARFWDRLCWYGSLRDRAADVLFAGEKAVALKPDDEDYKDARGLARALTGDRSGAIDDFQVALDSGVFRGTKKEKRQRWLEALQAGENPFTPEVLAELRRERR